MNEKHRKGLMLVLSSPSGAGKTSICRKILSLDEIINKPYSKITIELKENYNINEIKQILKKEGQTEINLVINKKNQRIHFNLQNPRKFDFNQLKTMKTKEYVKKITV